MKNIISFIVAFCAIFACFLGSILVTANDRSFYPEQYEANGTMQQTGMTIEDLTLASDALLDYMFDLRDDISVTVTVNGEQREAFDERETLHMVDVKELFLFALNFSYILAATSLVGVLLVLLLFKRQGLTALARMFNAASVVFVALGALLGVFIATNFNVFWTAFHLLVFTNDLWILDPNVSIMINMFPLDFFFAMCVDILIAFAVCLVSLFLILNIANTFIKKKIKK